METVSLVGTQPHSPHTCPDPHRRPPFPSQLIVANLLLTIHVGAAYQVYSQPVFYFVERNMQKWFAQWLSRMSPWVGSLLLRITFRTFYVVVSGLIAIVLPFFW